MRTLRYFKSFCLILWKSSEGTFLTNLRYANILIWFLYPLHAPVFDHDHLTNEGAGIFGDVALDSCITDALSTFFKIRMNNQRGGGIFEHRFMLF